MDDARLSSALDRTERALERIETLIGQSRQASDREIELRARVREAVAELDQIIRLAEVEV